MPRCTSAQTLLASPQHTGLYHPHLQAPGSTIFPILGSPKLDHGSALVQNYSWKPHPYGGPTLDGVTSPKPTYILHSPLYMVIENAGMLGFTTRLLKLTQFPQAHSAQSPCPCPHQPTSGRSRMLHDQIHSHIDKGSPFSISSSEPRSALGTKERLISNKIKVQSREEMRKTSPEAVPRPINDKCYTLMSESQGYKSHK